MCELLAVAAPHAFTLERLWPLALAMERYGLAGFGWGAAWVAGDGVLASHVSATALRDDVARESVGAARTRSAIVHLRRPSRLSTVGLPDAQPFRDPAGRFCFSPNGDLAGHWDARMRYRAQGRIDGRADSEVGQRWLEDRWTDGGEVDPCAHLAALHAAMGGQANLMALDRGGVAHVYAGNTENPVFRFALDDLTVAATGLYSMDRSLFRLAAPEARERRVLRPGDRADLRPA
jgi:hypothetical protein